MHSFAESIFPKDLNVVRQGSVHSDLNYTYFHKVVKHCQAKLQDSQREWSAIENLTQSNYIFVCHFRLRFRLPVTDYYFERCFKPTFPQLSYGARG